MHLARVRALKRFMYYLNNPCICMHLARVRALKLKRGRKGRNISKHLARPEGITPHSYYCLHWRSWSIVYILRYGRLFITS